jgi:NADH-quinone oxidoreductase subunit F
MLLAGADERDLTKLAEYQAIGGYEQVPKALKLSSDELIAELQQANLRGRGGAGFPMGRKASLVDRKSPKPKYLVVNADESEPGAFKDREVMARVPHRLLEGCLIAAHAIESKDVFIYIRGEYLTEYEILQKAVDEAREAGLFGEVNVTVYRGAGAYICGEETAMLDSLEGRRGQPRPRPPFPPVQGLYMAPTEINNVCTIATVPAILELGAEGFDQVGTPSSPGTVLFSISGNVEKPGNYELELGTSMRELIYTHAGGIAGKIDTRRFNPSFPANFPRFVQFAIWRFCAEAGLNRCNGNRIDDRAAWFLFQAQLRHQPWGASQVRLVTDQAQPIGWPPAPMPGFLAGRVGQIAGVVGRRRYR